MRKFLGIDIGGTDFKYGLYSENGDDLNQNGKIPAVKDSTQNTIDTISGIISKYSDIDGVGLCMPGRVDNETGKIHGSGSLLVLWGVELRPILEKRHKLPFAFENDANSAALAELWLGNGTECGNFICVTIGTGIGGSIVINNQLYRGNHYFAGEFCYVFMDSECSIMFNECSTKYLLKTINDNTSLRANCGKDVFDNLDKPDVFKVYDNWINTLALGIYNICTTLDPSKVLIGGGISAQERIYNDVEQAIQKIQHEHYPRFWTVEPCHFGNDAGKIGAVYSLIKRLD